MHIVYKLSADGQKADILAGGTGKAQQTIEVPPDTPEFARALDRAHMDAEGNGIVRVAGHYDRILTALEILDDLDQEDAEREAEKAAEQARQAQWAAERAARDEARRQAEREKEAHLRATALAVLAARQTRDGSAYEHGYYHYPVPDWPQGMPPDIKALPEAVAWQSELDAARETARIAHVAQVEQEQAEKAAAEDARRASKGLEEGETDWTISEGALVRVPLYTADGKSWMAIITIDPSKPGGLDRKFLANAKGDYYYLVKGKLAPGQALEFGADTYPRKREPIRQRWYGDVTRVVPETATTAGYLVLVQCDTGRAAVKAGQAYTANLAAGLLSDPAGPEIP